jgi:hypothetical protein
MESINKKRNGQLIFPRDSRLVGLPAMVTHTLGPGNAATQLLWYMPNTFGASVTVPDPSTFTRTPTKAVSAPQPNGAHPQTRTFGLPDNGFSQDELGIMTPPGSAVSATNA